MEKPGLVERARDEGLSNVTFLDAVPKSELIEMLPLFDIGIHCLADVELFHRGLSPNKLFDYLAANLPVVTNVRGPLAEIVSDFGIVVAPDGIEEGVAAIAEMTPDQRAQMGADGARYLSDNHSLDDLAATVDRTLSAVARK